jgi:hypothetical protein
MGSGEIASDEVEDYKTMKFAKIVLGLFITIVLLSLVVPRESIRGVMGPFMRPMMDRFNPPPKDLDYSTLRKTQGGRFIVSFTSNPAPTPLNQMHVWVLHVETPDGKPVENANILVDGGMPQHGHGLPTQPQVTQYLGNGNYRVEGMRFQMNGWWEVKFDINSNNAQDQVVFNLSL